jgi:hypothetical protein
VLLLLALVVLLIGLLLIAGWTPSEEGESGASWVRIKLGLRDLPQIARDAAHDFPLVWRASRSGGRGRRLHDAGQSSEALVHLQEAIAAADQIRGELAQPVQWTILLSAFTILTVAAASCGQRELALASIPRALNLVAVKKQLLPEQVDASLDEWERWARDYQARHGSN